MIRMRVVGWNVQPVLMADDGDNLTAVSVGVQMIPASEWALFKDGADVKALEILRAQIEKAPNGEARTLPAEPVETAT